MNRRRRQLSKWYLTAVTLLCLAVQVGAAQGVVLCFGAHGHVAIEPGGHHHCDGEIYDHDSAAEQIHEQAERFAPGRRSPCVDIPLPFSPLNERPSAGMFKSVGILPPAGPAAINPDRLPLLAAFQEGFLPTLSASLRTVVLQV